MQSHTTLPNQIQQRMHCRGVSVEMVVT